MPGEESTVRCREFVDDAPVNVQRALELHDGDAAICRERVVHAAGSAVELCTSWFSGALATSCPRLLDAEPIPEGTTRYVERRLGVTATRLDETDVARLATDRDTELLGIAPSTP